MRVPMLLGKDLKRLLLGRLVILLFRTGPDEGLLPDLVHGGSIELGLPKDGRFGVGVHG